MADLMEYKCPACGGAMEFDSKSQKMKCPYCDTEINPEDFQTEEESGNAAADSKWEAVAAERWSESEASGMSLYICESCGGEIVAEETTGATTCPFCGNRVVMKGQFAGDLKPNFIIPFKRNKKEAKAAYYNYLKNRKFLPRIFKDENHIDEMKGIYVPFWVFSGKARGDYTIDARRVTSWEVGDTSYTKTDYYRVRRAGIIEFDGVPADGSAKMPDELMDSIEPFKVSEAVPFQPAFLAGYLAERYDVDVEQCSAHAKKRMENTADAAMKRTAADYTTKTIMNRNLEIQNVHYSYALYPVWILNTTWKKQKFVFAMNGQTGKITGDLPLDKHAVRRYIAGRGVIYGAVLLALIQIFLRFG